MLAFILLLAFQLFTIIISANLLYGLALTLIRISALSIPALFAIIVLITPYLRFKGFMYSLDNNAITIYRGIINRKKDTVNLKNIQHIELSAYPFERIYKLATIKIYTAGSEHILPSIEVNDAIDIQKLTYRNNNK